MASAGLSFFPSSPAYPRYSRYASSVNQSHTPDLVADLQRRIADAVHALNLGSKGVSKRCDLMKSMLQPMIQRSSNQQLWEELDNILDELQSSTEKREMQGKILEYININKSDKFRRDYKKLTHKIKEIEAYLATLINQARGNGEIVKKEIKKSSSWPEILGIALLLILLHLLFKDDEARISFIVKVLGTTREKGASLIARHLSKETQAASNNNEIDELRVIADVVGIGKEFAFDLKLLEALIPIALELEAQKRIAEEQNRRVTALEDALTQPSSVKTDSEQPAVSPVNPTPIPNQPSEEALTRNSVKQPQDSSRSFSESVESSKAISQSCEGARNKAQAAIKEAEPVIQRLNELISQAKDQDIESAEQLEEVRRYLQAIKEAMAQVEAALEDVDLSIAQAKDQDTESAKQLGEVKQHLQAIKEVMAQVAATLKDAEELAKSLDKPEKDESGSISDLIVDDLSVQDERKEAQSEKPVEDELIFPLELTTAPPSSKSTAKMERVRSAESFKGNGGRTELQRREKSALHQSQSTQSAPLFADIVDSGVEVNGASFSDESSFSLENKTPVTQFDAFLGKLSKLEAEFDSLRAAWLDFSVAEPQVEVLRRQADFSQQTSVVETAQPSRTEPEESKQEPVKKSKRQDRRAAYDRLHLQALSRQVKTLQRQFATRMSNAEEANDHKQRVSQAEKNKFAKRSEESEQSQGEQSKKLKKPATKQRQVVNRAVGKRTVIRQVVLLSPDTSKKQHRAQQVESVELERRRGEELEQSEQDQSRDNAAVVSLSPEFANLGSSQAESASRVDAFQANHNNHVEKVEEVAQSQTQTQAEAEADIAKFSVDQVELLTSANDVEGMQHVPQVEKNRSTRRPEELEQSQGEKSKKPNTAAKIVGEQAGLSRLNVLKKKAKRHLDRKLEESKNQADTERANLRSDLEVLTSRVNDGEIRQREYEAKQDEKSEEVNEKFEGVKQSLAETKTNITKLSDDQAKLKSRVSNGEETQYILLDDSDKQAKRLKKLEQGLTQAEDDITKLCDDQTELEVRVDDGEETQRTLLDEQGRQARKLEKLGQEGVQAKTELTRLTSKIKTTEGRQRALQGEQNKYSGRLEEVEQCQREDENRITNLEKDSVSLGLGLHRAQELLRKQGMKQAALKLGIENLYHTQEACQTAHIEQLADHTQRLHAMNLRHAAMASAQSEWRSNVMQGIELSKRQQNAKISTLETQQRTLKRRADEHDEQIDGLSQDLVNETAARETGDKTQRQLTNRRYKRLLTEIEETKRDQVGIEELKDTVSLTVRQETTNSHAFQQRLANMVEASYSNLTPGAAHLSAELEDRVRRLGRTILQVTTRLTRLDNQVTNFFGNDWITLLSGLQGFLIDFDARLSALPEVGNTITRLSTSVDALSADNQVLRQEIAQAQQLREEELAERLAPFNTQIELLSHTAATLTAGQYRQNIELQNMQLTMDRGVLYVNGMISQINQEILRARGDWERELRTREQALLGFVNEQIDSLLIEQEKQKTEIKSEVEIFVYKTLEELKEVFVPGMQSIEEQLQESQQKLKRHENQLKGLRNGKAIKEIGDTLNEMKNSVVLRKDYNEGIENLHRDLAGLSAALDEIYAPIEPSEEARPNEISGHGMATQGMVSLGFSRPRPLRRIQRNV